jgi:Rieske Fe-S protein
MTAPQRPGHHLHRRTFAGVLTIGLGLPVLAACSGSDSSATVATDPNTPSSTPTESESSTPTEAPSESPSESPSEPPSDSPDAFAQTSDIEVGGGTIFSDEQIVITQPTEGQFKCFTAVCTHQSCIVSGVSAGNITCACHGSAFSIADGSVVNGPATQPLAEESISVQGGAIVLG